MGRNVTRICLALCSAVVILSAVNCRDVAVEYWYVWQLKSECAPRRRAAAVRLGEIGSVRALSHLMRTVEEDRERIVREAAVLSMFELALREDPWAVLARLREKSK